MPPSPHQPGSPGDQPPGQQPPHVDGSGAAGDGSRYEAFLRQFARHQSHVQAFIRSLVHDRTAADDVFQSTSLALWRAFDGFRPGDDFAAWAAGVARNEVLHFWRSRRRDRLVFSEAVVSALADAALDIAAEGDPRKEALQACLEGLPQRHRQLVEMFYLRRMPAGEIAASWNRTVHAVYKALKVMRRGLLDCVERRLASAP